MPKKRRQMRFIDLIRSDRRLRKNLIIAAVVSVVGGLIGGFLTYWDISHPVPFEKLVTIYRIHNCDCVSSWTKKLEDGGLIVRTFELESLKSERDKLGIPPELRGCHVAKFMNYFVESHVGAGGILRLAKEKPAGRGIVTEATLKAKGYAVEDDGEGPIYIIDSKGVPHEWRDPGTPLSSTLTQISMISLPPRRTRNE